MLALLTAAPAIAAGPAVSVRVEGLKRTLLATTVVHTHSGSITKGGTPAGVCPASSGAGALDVATHGNWNGKYSSGLGVEVDTILGETHVYTPKGYYWGIWLNNKFAQAGICDLTLHAGDQLLFAPSPATGSIYPIVISAPQRATVGRSFKVKLSFFGAKASAQPLGGVTVAGAGVVTNRQGVATVDPQKAGKLRLSASATGYIRSAVASVTVSG